MLTILLTSIILSSVLVAITLKTCRRFGWVAVPRSDRWHKGTMPAFFGGVPIWVGFILLAVAFLPASARLQWTVVALASGMFFLGFVDDIFHLRPVAKLLTQLLAASAAVYSGLVYPVRANHVVNVVVSILWIVGITNAFNLLDNMDGLSGGIAFISAMYLACFFLAGGGVINAVLAIVLAGVVGGFLFFNFYPAKIFMGDGGSLFIGFLLACVSLLGVTHISGVPALVFAPVTILAVPVFDTFFVSVTRRLRGQPISVGGTDHSSHRLVKLGLHERSAVLLLYGLAIASGSIALILRHVLYPHAIGLLAFWFLFLLLFGIHLFRTDMPIRARTILRVLGNLDHAAVLLDAVVLGLAYYFSFFLSLGALGLRQHAAFFFLSWPLVIAGKLAVLYFWKVYRHSWWRASAFAIYKVAGGIASAAIILVLVFFKLELSPEALVILPLYDCIMSFTLLFAIRMSSPLFRGMIQTLESRDHWGRRVLILGTSECTGAAIQFLNAQGIQCAGLIDTNGGSDLGRWVWGKKVVGRMSDLSELAHLHRVSEVVLPENALIPCSECELHDRCIRDNLRLTKLGLYTPVNQQKGNKVNSTVAGI